MNQRDKMRELYKRFNGDKAKCVAAYALAESRGEVLRKSNQYNISAEHYASGLFNEGVERKGWLK